MAAEQVPGYRHPAFVRAPAQKRPPTPRTCQGHLSKDGQVSCTYDLTGSVANRKRCPRCAEEHDNYRSNLRNKRLRGTLGRPQQKTCSGFDVHDNGHVDCDADLTGLGPNRKRCARCASKQRKFTRDRYHSTHGRTVSYTPVAPSQLPRSSTKRCDECAGLCERRPRAPRRCLCGLSWSKEVIERHAPLGSSMGMAARHGELYGHTSAWNVAFIRNGKVK